MKLNNVKCISHKTINNNGWLWNYYYDDTLFDCIRNFLPSNSKVYLYLQDGMVEGILLIK